MGTPAAGPTNLCQVEALKMTRLSVSSDASSISEIEVLRVTVRACVWPSARCAHTYEERPAPPAARWACPPPPPKHTHTHTHTHTSHTHTLLSAMNFPSATTRTTETHGQSFAEQLSISWVAGAEWSNTPPPPRTRISLWKKMKFYKRTY